MASTYNTQRNNLTFEGKCFLCNQKLATRYCEECFLILCGDCVNIIKHLIFRCKNCGGNSTELRSTDVNSQRDVLSCKICGSLNLEPSLKSIDGCPSCNSPKVLPISEKRVNLFQELRKNLGGFKFGFNELRKFLQRNQGLIESIRQLRLCGFLHNPRIEAGQFAIIKLSKIVSEQILEQFLYETSLIGMQLKPYPNYTHWSAYDFPHIELMISQIQESVIKYQLTIKEILSQFIKRRTKIEGQLRVIQFYKSIYDKVSEDFSPLRGELPVCAFENVQLCKNTVEKSANGCGKLLITDKRVVFLQKASLFKKQVHARFEFFLERIMGVAVRGRIRKRLQIVLEQGNIELSSSIQKMGAISDYLNIASNFQRYRLHNLRSLEDLTQFRLAFRYFKTRVNRRIMSILSGAR